MLLAAAPACAQSPGALEHYHQGTEALEAGHVEAARRHFAEAVALDPEFPGAWLDLAVATARAGDAAQAEEFLDILEARFALPGPIAETVAALRARLSARLAAEQAARAARLARAEAGWQWQHSVQAGGGYDSNANAGLSLGSLTLTLPGGHVVLPLDQAYLPRADAYTLFAAGTAGLRPAGNGLLGLNASLRWRRNMAERDFDAVELRAGLSYTSESPLFGPGPDADGEAAPGLGGLLPGPWRASATVQQVRLGGAALQNSAAVAIEHVWPQAACRPLGSAELDFRVHPVARNLDAFYLWLGVAWRCPGLPIPQAHQLQAQLRVGQAFARHGGENGRPGGNSRHVELALLHEWRWPRETGGEHRLSARAQWERVRDTGGYSPLLADNAVRQVTRSAAGLSWSLPVPELGEPWQAVFDLQRFRQRSNLEVFDLSGHLLQLTLQRNW
ncbi:MAG: tetratricopeptide repeat protein [Burkholderiaceae bacterium]